MVFRHNPLSLSIPQATLDAWAHEAAPIVNASNRRSGNPAGRSIANLTVDDLMQPPKPWREFFAIDRLRDAYGFPDRILRDIPGRITENIYTFIGNYLRVALVLMLCVLYKRPLAMLGILVVAKAWDWFRLNSADVDRQGLSYKISYVVLTIFTWAVLVYAAVTIALFIGALVTIGVICLHGGLRRRGPLKPLQNGRRR
mmetsp:Transcript_35735/g.60222  ORF Transcript_35735/g.60222 Transcript_35735/m.60222 type:complete len:199 (+) Transcript_35735:290-886(+)